MTITIDPFCLQFNKITCNICLIYTEFFIEQRFQNAKYKFQQIRMTRKFTHTCTQDEKVTYRRKCVFFFYIRLSWYANGKMNVSQNII